MEAADACQVRGEAPDVGVVPALAHEALRLDDDGAARAALALPHADVRVHLEALLADAPGDHGEAAVRWRDLRTSRLPLLAAAAQRRLDEP